MGGKEEIRAHKACVPSFPKNCFNPSPTDLPARKKHDAVPPQLLNADPLAQIIGTKMVADVIIDDLEACTLLNSRATADLMTLAYTKARNFDIKPMTELSNCFVNLRLAVGFKTTMSGYIEYNLQIPGISLYNSDQVALVAEDNTEFGQEVPLTIGMKTEDTILEAPKKGELEMLDSIWKRVRMQEALIQVAKAAGQEPPEFKDHTPYSNRGMEDLLKLNLLVPQKHKISHLNQIKPSKLKLL